MEPINSKVEKRKRTEEEEEGERPIKRPRYREILLMARMHNSRFELLEKMRTAAASLDLCRPVQLKDQEAFNSIFKVDRLLKEDRYASVYAGERRSDGLQVRIKQMCSRQRVMCTLDEGRPAIFEAAVLEFLGRPGSTLTRGECTQLVGTFYRHGRFFIVTKDIPDAVSLEAICKTTTTSNDGRPPVSEETAWLIVSQLYVALTTLARDEGVFRGPLKSSQVLVNFDQLSVHLEDFQDAGAYTNKYGYRDDGETMMHLPAEGGLYPFAYYYMADEATIFTLGVLLYEMLSGGRHPFKDTKDCLDILEMPQGISPQCEDVIAACLAPKSQRVHFDKLIEMPWFWMPTSHQRLKEEMASIKQKMTEQQV